MLIIDWGPVFEESVVYGNDINLSVFYCLCFMKEIIMVMLEEESRGERDPGIRVYEDVRISHDR